MKETSTSGPYGLLVLAPVNGMGFLWAPQLQFRISAKKYFRAPYIHFWGVYFAIKKILFGCVEIFTHGPGGGTMGLQMGGGVGGFLLL